MLHRPAVGGRTEIRISLKTRRCRRATSAAVDRWIPMIRAYTGCRPSEASGLRRDDVKELRDPRSLRADRSGLSRVTRLTEGTALPTLRADAYSSMGAAWGSTIAIARKLVPDRRKVAHSWRHTVAPKLRQAGRARRCQGPTTRLDFGEDESKVWDWFRCGDVEGVGRSSLHPSLGFTAIKHQRNVQPSAHNSSTPTNNTP